MEMLLSLPLSSPSPSLSSSLLISPSFKCFPSYLHNHLDCKKLALPIRSTGRASLPQKRAGSARPSAVAVNDNASADVIVTESMEPHSRVRLKVKVPPQICKESYDYVLREFSKKAEIPGFRQGKSIPESVLVNFVGKEQINASAVEAVLRRTFPEAMSSVAGRALKDSEQILSKFKELQSSFSPTGVFSYEVAVDVAPAVNWTSENAYRNLKVTIEVEDETSPQTAAEAELRSRHKDLGSLRVVQDRGVQIGDVAILDVSAARIKDDGTLGDKILSAEQKGFQLDTEESANFLPGFVEATLGIERGQTRSFNLAFPQTWQQEALRGVNACFSVECKELFYRVLPDLDDSIADSLLENCTTLDQVKELLLEKHQDLAYKTKKQATQLAILEELAQVTEIDIPHSLLEEQGRQMYAAKLIELQASKKLSKEQVVALSSEEMVKNYLISQKDKITGTVKQTLAVAEIYKLENLKYSEEELSKEVESAEQEFKHYNQEYDRNRIREQAEELLEAAKVLDWLAEHADITYVTRK